MFGRVKLLSQFWKTGRLAARLARDSRVPMTAKLVLGGALMYLVSPIDVVPDWIPIAGQADDLMVLLAGLNLFIKACPRWLVAEHGGAIDRGTTDPDTQDGELRPRRTRSQASASGGRGWDDESAPSGRNDAGMSGGSRPSTGQVIEGQYRRVR